VTAVYTVQPIRDGWGIVLTMPDHLPSRIGPVYRAKYRAIEAAARLNHPTRKDTP
jgi:hypothetical protein